MKAIISAAIFSVLFFVFMLAASGMVSNVVKPFIEAIGKAAGA